MKVSLSITQKFTPEWRGNRDLPTDEQIVVTYRLMTAEQEERFARMSAKSDGSGEYMVNIEPKAVEIFGACVTHIAGLFDTAGAPITEAAEVLKIPGIYDLIGDVAAEIKKGLITEEDSKN